MSRPSALAAGRPHARRAWLGAARWLLLAAAAACAGRDSVVIDPGGGAAPAPGSITECSVGRQRAALSVVDRSLLGSPAEYRADATLPGRDFELWRSQRARREVGWQIAARVLAPVPLAAPLLGSGTPESLPAWQTWHAKDDLTRIFRRAYPQLTPAERAARAPLAAGALDEAWAWNDGAVSEVPEWTAERLAEYRAAVTEASEAAGLAGIYRVAYAPAAGRQLLDSYAEVLRCREAEGSAAAGATLGIPEAGPCGLAPSPPPDCLASAFPASASIIKASWRRADIGLPLPVYDTSAAALERRLGPDGSVSWDEPDGEADPGPEQIYTLRLPNGNTFRLAALHIMTKELDHWFWATLWWSPQPDGDFGADRPANLPAPWQNYKLCSVVAYDEADPAPDGGFAEYPSLADSLAATHSGVGGRSWCSNPYLEDGPGNAASNCIGCHQHAGTGLRTETILADAAAFPDHSRRLVRADFPSDYVFGVSVGDDLGAMFLETEQHYAP